MASFQSGPFSITDEAARPDPWAELDHTDSDCDYYDVIFVVGQVTIDAIDVHNYTVKELLQHAYHLVGDQGTVAVTLFQSACWVQAQAGDNIK